LNFWYAVIFTASAAGLFLLLYYSLVSAVERKEREVIEARLKEYAVIYGSSGVAGLRSWLARDPQSARQKPFFIRLVNRWNQPLLLQAPEDWIEFKDIDGGWEGYRRQVGVLRIPKDEEREFVLVSQHFPDGSLLQVGRSASSRETLFRPFLRTFLVALGVTAVIGFTAGAAFAHHATRPIRAIVGAAREIIRTRTLDARVSTGQSDDQLDELARLFNTMLDQNQALIKAMREALDNVAHDLRTPLARLRGVAELALRDSADLPATREALAECVEESDRVLNMLKAVMDITEAEAGMLRLDRVPTDLGQLLDEVIEVYSFLAEEKQIAIRRDYTGRCEARVDPNRMRQVFGNLLDNALKYTAPGGHVAVRLEQTPEAALVRFRDDGMGIAEDDLPRIWTRLYRGDKSRSQRGLGLGLSLVKAIVEAHGGRVAVQSQVGDGSEFTVRLPHSPPHDADPPDRAPLTSTRILA